ncbi:MAG: SufE family protein, partial [Wenzhouxiangella sp.]
MNAIQAQQEIVDEFSFFDSWMEGGYEYLIDLGNKLPELAPEEMTDDRLLEGCQSQVWFVAEGDADRLVFRARSDAKI